MNSKKSITILATIAVLVTLGSALFFEPFQASALTYTETYATVSGVLSTDSYVLFPYLKKDLTIGFSKYGELIDGNTKTGMLYDGYDAFAPHEGVYEWNWVNGWIINITYVEGGDYMNRWAFALYSDYTSGGVGQDWNQGVVGGSTTTNPLYAGGRKTNGGAHTEPIQVLYDGPRRFVALLNTTIYEDVGHTIKLVSVIFTIIFNKDKKQVIILKDIKRIDTGLKNIGDMQIEFGDRGEWDLGRSIDEGNPASYAHIYEDQPTVYDGDYQAWYKGADPTYFEGTYDVCQFIDDESQYVGWAAYWPKPIVMWVGSTQSEADRDIILETMVTKTEQFLVTALDQVFPTTWTPALYPQNVSGTIIWRSDPMVFVDGKSKAESTAWDWDSVNHQVTFKTGYHPAIHSNVTIVYKWRGDKYDTSRPDDMTPETGEQSPFLIGEWAFKMTTKKQQFRGVTIYGVTNRNDGDDDDMDGIPAGGDHTNVLDREVQYYLNETFNPFDLRDAVEKQDSRWVDIKDLTASANQYNLTIGIDDTNYYNVTSGAWEPYYLSPERWTADPDPVESTWVNKYEDGTTYFDDFAVSELTHSKNWALDLYASQQSYGGISNVEMLMITPKATTPTATAPLTLRLGDLVDFDFWYYPLSPINHGPWIEINVTDNANPALAAHFFTIQASTVNPETSAGWHHYTLNTIANFVPGGAEACFQKADGNIPESGWHSFEYWTSKYPNYYVHYVGVGLAIGRSLIDDVSIGYLDRASGIRYERVYNMEEDKLIPSDWGAYCTSAERVLVDGVLIPRYGWHNATDYQSYYCIDFATGEITFWNYSSSVDDYVHWRLSIGTHIKILYSTIEENDKGRYEWIVVGKPAATVDSLATAYVAQAFDSIKDIHVMEAGMDFRDTTWGPNIPYVMAGPGTGTRTDYVDSALAACGRPHLKDDWCSTWPVASSNMIFMAGPRANLGTEYMNEFTNVFFPRSECVVNNSLGQSNTIFALTCWNHRVYTSGYGVISVYKDLNGTVGLVFWGVEAQDFYYTCQWFWSYPTGILCPDGCTIVYSGIEYLQHENPGVTDLILHIDYTHPTHPTVSISYKNERLGTISEKVQHDP